ncbi:hypothetical protein TNCV_4492161 [Trichonephila clavipes]|nr:hypothetical protein TNCV_4492161 [Trichonephila clavipes]
MEAEGDDSDESKQREKGHENHRRRLDRKGNRHISTEPLYFFKNNESQLEIDVSKMEAKTENKIKQEENIDADEDKLKQPITIIQNDIQFEDLQTFFQKYNLEMPIQIFLRNFESTSGSFDITEIPIYITKLVDGAVKTYIKSQLIPKSFDELKNNLIRVFGTQVNPAEIHLQLSKTEQTSKETHIEYFYRIKEIASWISMEEEAEKFYIIKGLKENRSIEIQLQSCSNIEELKEKMKL